MGQVSRERAEMIRKVWVDVSRKVDWTRGHIVKAYAPIKLPPITSEPTAVCDVELDVLEFRRERTVLDGQRVNRVTCEGVPVQIWTE